MATYLLAGLSLFLLLVCGGCFSAVLKAVRMQEHDEKQRHYLEMALRASGHWDDYQRALRHSWELWAQADNEPRAKAEAKAKAKAKVDAEVRAARGRAIGAEAKATPEAQAKREARAAKAAK